MKLEFVGQPSFSFRIPSAPLQPEYKIPTYYNDYSNFIRVRAQTQNRVLFEGNVSKSWVDRALGLLRVNYQGAAQGSITYFSLTTTGGRSLWSGYTSQGTIDSVVHVLQTGQPLLFLPGMRFHRQAQVRSRGGSSMAALFGTPNTLGDVAAGVSVGGGLLGLAVLALAGYGVYKLVK
jgi:hypothetical protein